MFSLRLGPRVFGIFDAFADENGREAHLNGPFAKALMAQAPDLFVAPPTIEKCELLGTKVSR
jgi:quinol monooxygenase YgiN